MCPCFPGREIKNNFSSSATQARQKREFKTTIKSNISFIETNSEHQNKTLTLVSSTYFWDRGQETKAIGKRGLKMELNVTFYQSSTQNRTLRDIDRD